MAERGAGVAVARRAALASVLENIVMQNYPVNQGLEVLSRGGDSDLRVKQGMPVTECFESEGRFDISLADKMRWKR